MIEVFDKNNLEKELKPLQEKLLFIESVYINKVAMLEQVVRTLQRTVERLQERTVHISTPLADSSPFYDFIRRESMPETVDRVYYNDSTVHIKGQSV